MPLDPPPQVTRPAFGWQGFGVIAEVKRASPSRGAIADHPIGPWAASLAAGGAKALSILTEAKHFGGSLENLRLARAACELPLLRKDFLIAEFELDEAVAAGASAVLLIAAALPAQEIVALYRAARARQLAVLLEVHGEHELAVCGDCPEALIGFNQRDLETLAVDPRAAERVAPRMPAGRRWIVESGISSAADVRWAKALGASGVLVGEALARSPDPGAELKAWLQEIL